MNLCIVTEDKKYVPISIMFMATQVMVQGWYIKNKLPPNESCDVIIKAYRTDGVYTLDVLSVKDVSPEKLKMIKQVYKAYAHKNEIHQQALLTL